jgi:hypothetical protein
MENVYIETTVVSLLAANPSRDLARAGQQQTTPDWWQQTLTAFHCVTTDETLVEAARGDTEQARLRLGRPFWVGAPDGLHPIRGMALT